VKCICVPLRQIDLGLNDSRTFIDMGEVGTPRALPYSTSRMTSREVLGQLLAAPSPGNTSSAKEIYVIRV